MPNVKKEEKLSKQLVGNTGLFYVCYELSKRGWNCLPTTRNSKGVDIVIYGSKGERKFIIQVKSLSEKNAVSFGIKKRPEPQEIIADFLIICRKVKSDKPEIFILNRKEVGEKLT